MGSAGFILAVLGIESSASHLLYKHPNTEPFSQSLRYKEMLLLPHHPQVFGLQGCTHMSDLLLLLYWGRGDHVEKADFGKIYIYKKIYTDSYLAFYVFIYYVKHINF